MVISIPLRIAQLCFNCEEVSVLGTNRCPVCESIALRPLSAILDRETVLTFPQLVDQILERKTGDN